MQMTGNATNTSHTEKQAGDHTYTHTGTHIAEELKLQHSIEMISFVMDLHLFYFPKYLMFYLTFFLLVSSLFHKQVKCEFCEFVE